MTIDKMAAKQMENFDERVEAKAQWICKCLHRLTPKYLTVIERRDIKGIARAVLISEIEARVEECEYLRLASAGTWKEYLKRRIAELTAELEQIRRMG